jgi:hypothetical protein
MNANALDTCDHPRQDPLDSLLPRLRKPRPLDWLRRAWHYIADRPLV